MKRIVTVSIILIVLSLSLMSCEKHFIKTFPIISIGKDRGIEGDFFLGCGTVNDITYFISYVMLSYGKIKLVKINIDRVLICEIEEGEPHASFDYYGGALGDINVEEHLNRGWQRRLLQVIFYVPKGTILREFKL